MEHPPFDAPASMKPGDVAIDDHGQVWTLSDKGKWKQVDSPELSKLASTDPEYEEARTRWDRYFGPTARPSEPARVDLMETLAYQQRVAGC